MVSRRKLAGCDASRAFILLYPSSPSAISATAKAPFTPAAIRSGAVAPPVATVRAVSPTTVTRLITPSSTFCLLSLFLVTMSFLTASFSSVRIVTSVASCSLSNSSPDGDAFGEESASCVIRADSASIPDSIVMQSSAPSPICITSFFSPQIISSFTGLFLPDIIPICVFSVISMPFTDRKPPLSR